MTQIEPNFILQFATPEQIDDWAKRHRLSNNEVTALHALESVWLFLNKKDIYYMRRNLEDAKSFATPRLRGMTRSINKHLNDFDDIRSYGEHRLLWHKHFDAFRRAIKA